MPKRTAILLFVFAVIVIFSGAAVSRWAAYDGSTFGYWFASEAKGIFEMALLSTVTFWSAVGSAKRLLRWASTIGAALFVLAEHAYFVPLILGMRRWEVAMLGMLPQILGTICGAYLMAGWLVAKRLSLRPIDQLPNENTNFRFRFSVGELFVLTFVCAALLGLASIASLELADGWKSRARFMLAVALLGFPYGVWAGMAAWSILLHRSRWRTIPFCLALIAGFTWGINFFVFGDLATSDLTYFLLFPLLLFTAQAAIFWTFRSAGYRLVWRENASVGDNPAPA